MNEFDRAMLNKIRWNIDGWIDADKKGVRTTNWAEFLPESKEVSQ